MTADYDGYYDPSPRWWLPRTTIVAGQLGCGAPAVARHVAARTGLPFVELDRLVEHEAGRSLARIAFDEGREGVERRAETILGRVVGRSPRGLIALDHAWPSTASRRMLARQTCLLHLRRPPGYLVKRLEREVLRAGDWILAGESLPAEGIVDPSTILARREPLLRDACVVLDAGDRHAHDVALILLESLEHVADAKRL